MKYVAHCHDAMSEMRSVVQSVSYLACVFLMCFLRKDNPKFLWWFCGRDQ